MTFNKYYNRLENLYQFTGKESQPEIGWVDYGARMNDASISIWNHIDPLADNYLAFSPYNYTLKNPIKYVDPVGMRVSLWDEMKARHSLANNGENEEGASTESASKPNLPKPIADFFHKWFISWGLKAGERKSKNTVDAPRFIIYREDGEGFNIEDFGGAYDPNKKTISITISEIKDLLSSIG